MGRAAGDDPDVMGPWQQGERPDEACGSRFWLEPALAVWPTEHYPAKGRMKAVFLVSDMLNAGSAILWYLTDSRSISISTEMDYSR